MQKLKHPIQPIEEDEHGVLRFKANSIVKFLLDNGPFDLNDIAIKEFSKEDQEQFAQLIGYSLSGFSELSYVSDKTYEVAYIMSSNGNDEKEAQSEYFESTLDVVRKGLREIVPALFKIHPDDLEE